MAQKRARPEDSAPLTAAAKRPRREIPAKKAPTQETPASVPQAPARKRSAEAPAATKRRGRPPGNTKNKVSTTGKGRGRPAGTTKAKAEASKPITQKAASTKPKTTGTKRLRKDDDAPAAPKPAKRAKIEPVINTVPTQKLDVYVMGSGECGELGLGATKRNGQDPTGAARPALNDLLDAKTVGVVQVAAGGMHCAALTHDSRILTWGVNDTGALGRDTAYEAPARDEGADSDSEDDIDLNPRECTPTAIPEEAFEGLSKIFVQVVATSSATFALTAEGRVIGCGQFRGASGSIGFSTEAADKNVMMQRTPILIPKLAKITALAAGSDHVLALDQKGKVYAWGCGEQGQLGRRIVGRRETAALTPAACGIRGRVVSIAGGAYHSFAITERGEVYAFGLNNFGQTGIAEGAGGNEAIITTPQRVRSLADFDIAQIDGGCHHSIARTKDGRAIVFGRADDQQMGIALDDMAAEAVIRDSRDRPQALVIPSEVPGLKAMSVAAGLDDTLAVSTDGVPFGWGFSENYRTGLKTEDAVERPTQIKSAAIKDKKMSLVACGGQFSVMAGHAVDGAST